MSINKSNSALMRKDKIAKEIRQQIENSKAISNKLQNPSNTIQNNEVLPENVANSFPPLNDNLIIQNPMKLPFRTTIQQLLFLRT